MESTEKETRKKQETESIWLSLNEMVKLSILMTIASQFWLERLEKDEGYSIERIQAFKKSWKQMREAIDDLL